MAMKDVQLFNRLKPKKNEEQKEKKESLENFGKKQLGKEKRSFILGAGGLNSSTSESEASVDVGKFKGVEGSRFLKALRFCYFKGFYEVVWRFSEVFVEKFWECLTFLSLFELFLCFLAFSCVPIGIYWDSTRCVVDGVGVSLEGVVRV